MTHQPEAWMTDAVCATVATELFFPVKGTTQRERQEMLKEAVA